METNSCLDVSGSEAAPERSRCGRESGEGAGSTLCLDHLSFKWFLCGLFYLHTPLCVFCLLWVVKCRISGFRSSYVIYCTVYIIIIYYIHMLAVLGFRCCLWAFSTCSNHGLLSSCGVWASHWGGFSCCRTQALGCSCFNSCGSQALEHSLSSCVWA